MDYQKISFWVSLFQWITTAGVWLYVWNVNRNRVTGSRIKALETTMASEHAKQTERIARLEQDQRHAPTHDDLKRLHKRLDEVNGELKQLCGTVNASNHTLTLIHRHLLDSKP